MSENNELILFRLEKSEVDVKKIEDKIDLLLEITNNTSLLTLEVKNIVDREVLRIRELEIIASELKTDRNWLKKIQFLMIGALISGTVGLISGVIALFLKK